MKRIIYFGNNNPFKHKRGIENVIEFQSKSILEAKKYYIFFDDEINIKIFRWNNILCIGIPHNKYRFISLNFIVRKIQKKIARNCIIHSHNPLMSFFYTGKIDLMTVHDGLYYRNKEVKHKLTKIFYFIEKVIYKKTKNVQFISKFSKQMSLYEYDNYILIPNSTPFEKFKTLDMKKESTKKWSNNKLKVFTVRSIEERARIDLLIDLATEIKEIEIKVAGKGPLLDFFLNVIKERKLTNIQLLGFSLDEDVVSYYKTCDLVIVPAEHGEGFGLPIIEGYLFNKPVICSNKCAIPEVVISEEFLFENNIKSLEETIEKIIKNNKYKKYNYEKYYTENFSFRIILKNYEKLYRKIMKG